MTNPEITKSWLHIPSGEGFDLIAFVARPHVAGRVPVLFVIPENPGIVAGRQAETVRQAAELGAAVVVISTYSRIGGRPPVGPFASDDERRRANFLAMPDEQVAGDLEKIIAAVLGEEPWADPERAALLGYCSGGSQAFYAAATRDLPARALLVIYGNIVLRGEFTEDRVPIDRVPLAGAIDVPIQLHYGDLDHEISPEQVARLRHELETHGKDFEIFTYPGARHVFADPNHPNHHPEATELLWQRAYPFLRRYLES